MPEPCDCSVNKNVDVSKPKKCSCPSGTHDIINENQQEISESASSSNKTNNLAPNQPNMSQSSQNKNENGPNMLQSNQNEIGTSNQPGQLGGTSQNNVNDVPAVTNPWENCKCNFPEISPICKCSEAENDVSGDKVVKQLRMAAIKDNEPLDEDKNVASTKKISPDESEAQPDTELASKDQSSSSENKGDKLRKDKAVGDIPPDTDLPSKATEEQSSPRTHLVEGDVPPDEGEIKDLKDLSKYICTCDKEKQASNKTNQNSDTNPANCERTFIMIKPDGVQRGLVGKIIKRFEQKGFHLVALSFLWPSEELLKKHYAELSDRPFFPTLIQYMSSGPVVPMVWEGLGIVKAGRSLLGATNPADSAAGTIRGDLCIQVGRNICHASDSNDSANKEIDLWFTEKELIPWVSVNRTWVYED